MAVFSGVLAWVLPPIQPYRNNVPTLLLCGETQFSPSGGGFRGFAIDRLTFLCLAWKVPRHPGIRCITRNTKQNARITKIQPKQRGKKAPPNQFFSCCAEGIFIQHLVGSVSCLVE